MSNCSRSLLLATLQDWKVRSDSDIFMIAAWELRNTARVTLSFILAHPFGSPCIWTVVTNEATGAGRGVGMNVGIPLGTSVDGNPVGLSDGR